MPLNPYQRLAYRILGSTVEKEAASNIHLRLSLLKAHIPMRPEVYLSYSYLNMLVALALTALPVAALGILVGTGLVALPATAVILLIPLPLVVAGTIYIVTFIAPDMRATERARDIDAKLPYALNYISTMASAGVTPEKVFASLADQRLYGEVANEAAWISRDLSVLGKDLVTALTAAIDRSPSIKFQDFLQGAITALQSGSDVKQYFLTKSEQYVYQNRQDQKKFLETLGVLAESFVTIVVAAPVFMIILLSVMIMFGGNPQETIRLGYLLILLLLPMAQVFFIGTIKYITPEV